MQNAVRDIAHAKKVIAAYKAWDAKYLPGRHEIKIKEWENRLKALAEKHRKLCCKP